MAVSKLNPVAGGVTPKVQTFTSTGSFVAPANTQYVEVFLVGAGGAGGGSVSAGSAGTGGGGGGGQVISWQKLAVTGGTTYTVTIGAGGAGSTADASGAVGNDTTFGSLATAYGGGGGATRGSVQHSPRMRATNGGISATDPSTGAGSGAGAASIYSPTTGTSAFGTIGAGISIVNGGGIVASIGNGASSSWPGLGVDGYGGGGPRGDDNATGFGSDNWPYFSYAGSGKAGGLNTAGGNGVANSGGGGAGAHKSGAQPVRAGGNGGSGYAVVAYWS